MKIVLAMLYGVKASHWFEGGWFMVVGTPWRIIPVDGSVVNNPGEVSKSPKDRVGLDPFQMAELHDL